MRLSTFQDQPSHAHHREQTKAAQQQNAQAQADFRQAAKGQPQGQEHQGGHGQPAASINYV
jgi:hypothetical protein